MVDEQNASLLGTCQVSNLVCDRAKRGRTDNSYAARAAYEKSLDTVWIWTFAYILRIAKSSRLAAE